MFHTLRARAPALRRAPLLASASSPSSCSAAPAAPAAAAAASPRRAFSSAEGGSPSQHTALHDFHVAHQGTMVSFAGWKMPVQYKALSIIESTLHTREKASLFDVGHMGQLVFRGDGAEAFLESLIVADLSKLKPLGCKYTLLTNEDGGIIDDCIVTRWPTELGLVVNAGRLPEVLAHLEAQAAAWQGAGVTFEHFSERSLIALQGPAAQDVLQRLVTAEQLDVAELGFFRAVELASSALSASPVRITRSGYTGEDGFEISVVNGDAAALAESLVAQDEVELAGLGARDALRLEAGMCLYGHDIDDSTTPVEADLMWAVAKSRLARSDFPGAKRIARQLAEPERHLTRKRVGLAWEGRRAAREGFPILDLEDGEAGVVTSGSFSPCLSKPIAMGYVTPELAAPGTSLRVQFKKHQEDVTVVPTPFFPTNYYTKAKKAKKV